MTNFFYYIFLLNLILLSAIVVTAAFSCIGWIFAKKEAKQERQNNHLLKIKLNDQRLEIESLQAKNCFLRNRISEVEKNGGKN